MIRRNVLENPAWYTAYTPYQPEISQGRLEALLNFQTMVSDLTGLAVANASLLDEASAAAEAMTLARRVAGPKRATSSSPTPTASRRPWTCCAPAPSRWGSTCASPASPRTPTSPAASSASCCSTRARPARSATSRPVIEAAHAAGATVAVAADILALTLLKPPGELGADIALGSTQRFGVPMFYGGPHAAYMAVRDDLRRQLPGRLVGVSVDADGNPAFRLALQAREQHIRREKATSNICTAQVLLAVAAAMYAVLPRPRRPDRHRARVLIAAPMTLAATLRTTGCRTGGGVSFDTIRVLLPGPAEARAAPCGAPRRRATTCTTRATAWCRWRATRRPPRRTCATWSPALVGASTRRQRAGRGRRACWSRRTSDAIPAALARTSKFLTHPVFSAHRSETAMLRYLRRLSDLDVALDRSMIPLGSCTMKLNATAEMEADHLAGVRRAAPAGARRRTRPATPS